jgi:hypothetical protein
MNSQSKHLTRRLFASVAYVVALSTATARGDGSILFNGTTSRIQNDSAPVLGTVTKITVCAWVYAESRGGGGSGSILRLNEQGDKIILGYENLSTDMHFYADSGHWTFPLSLQDWRAISVTHDLTTNGPPAVRVNFASETVTPVVSATSALPDSGYCVGNFSGGTTGWHGKIAHVQVFNRVLTPAETDRALLTPGSVTEGLRLWLPMTNELDIYDRSGNGFDGTPKGTDPDKVSTGNNSPPIDRKSGLAPGIVMLPSGITSITQLVIPRYGEGTNYPSGQLRGCGPASEIRANAFTVTLPSTPKDTRSVVMTEDFAEPIGQWQSDTADKKAVLQAAVRDLTIAGYDETGTDYFSPGVVNNQPAIWNRIVGAISNVTPTQPVRITSWNHSLPTGASVTIKDVEGMTGISENPYTITKLTGSILYTSNTNPMQVYSSGHNLQNGTVIDIYGVTDNQDANDVWTVTVLDSNIFTVPLDASMLQQGDDGGWTSRDIFSLDNSSASGTYVPDTGRWESDYWDDKYHGLLIRCSGPLVENVNFFYIPGTALEVLKGGTGSHTGPKLAFDREKARIWDCKVNRAYSGFHIRDVDAVVGRLEGSELRDFGIKFSPPVDGQPGAGSVQIEGPLHFYGVGTGGIDQPAVWFASGTGGCWGGPIYAESSPVGILVESSDNQLGPVHSHSCGIANLRIWGEYNRFSPFDIRADAVGALIEGGKFASFVNGTFIVQSNAKGIKLASGNAGEGLIVDDVVFNAYGKSNTVGIDANVTISDSTIIATFIGGDNVGSGNVCIDLKEDNGTSRLGERNYIRITTRNWTGADTDIDLPTSWSTSNTIIVNGQPRTP